MQNIAFDLDGTLLKSFIRHRYVLELALQKNSISLKLSDLIEAKRNGMSNEKYLLSKNLDIKLIRNICDYWCYHIEDIRFLELDRLYVNSYNILIRNRLKNNKLFLITARNNSKNCNIQIDKLGIRGYFNEIFIIPSNSSSYQSKAQILMQNKVDYFIGDTEVDKKAALISGVKFIPCYHGFRSKLFLDKV
ncbi:HAD family hydrolase, partial [Campylobacter coli]|nr:HAD family hydrolase [Campylobacter coli]